MRLNHTWFNSISLQNSKKMYFVNFAMLKSQTKWRGYELFLNWNWSNYHILSQTIKRIEKKTPRTNLWIYFPLYFFGGEFIHTHKTRQTTNSPKNKIQSNQSSTHLLWLHHDTPIFLSFIQLFLNFVFSFVKLKL